MFRELDERVKRMWYSSNIKIGMQEADDLICRVKNIQKEGYIVPIHYEALAYNYGTWIVGYGSRSLT